jgi:RimJ/RimL family protein N-acetyltransferase
MNIQIYRTQDRDFLANYFVKERVWELSSSGKPWTSKEFVLNPELLYLVAADGHEVLCVFVIDPWTEKTVEMHLHCRRKYWGKGIIDPCLDELKKVLHDTLKYDILVTSSPRLCTEVLEVLRRNNCHQVGCIEGGTAYKGETCDMLLFSYKL